MLLWANIKTSDHWGAFGIYQYLRVGAGNTLYPTFPNVGYQYLNVFKGHLIRLDEGALNTLFGGCDGVLGEIAKSIIPDRAAEVLRLGFNLPGATSRTSLADVPKNDIIDVIKYITGATNNNRATELKAEWDRLLKK